jgi:predicted small metal-binding protein
MPSFRCKDIGMKDKFQARDDNKDELMKIIALHAKESHNINEISPEMKEKIEKAIRK